MDDLGVPDWLTENDDGSVTVDFGDRAPNIDGTKVREITMREPTVEDQVTAQKGRNAAEAEIALIASLTEVSPQALRGMTLRQYGRVQTALQLFTV